MEPANTYRIGIERRFWFTKWIEVTGHKWENFRAIFSLADGSEYSVPGFKAAGFMVDGPSFQRHLVWLRQKAELDDAIRAADAARLAAQQEFEEYQRMKRAGATAYVEVPRETPAPVAPVQTATIDPADPRYDFSEDAEERPQPAPAITDQARLNARARIAALS